MTAPVIWWLRRDLRLTDQPALLAALSGKGNAPTPVIPVYVLDDETPRHRIMGGASRWWLHHSLASLDAALRARGSRLILRRGRSEDVLVALAQESGARTIHALHHHEPWWRNAERAVEKRLDLRLHHGNYLLPPGFLTNGSGAPYRIFTPFMRALMAHMPPSAPRPAPDHILAPEHWPDSEALADWALISSMPDWAHGFRAEWTPGEAGAAERLSDFAAHSHAYEAEHDLPSKEGTSRLSPHLHFGEISSATVWHQLAGRDDAGTSAFLRQVIWRDYAQNIICSFPDYGARPAKEMFDGLAWRTGVAAEADYLAWQQGRTGYPIVDAGMRQLWHSGWMHNRVRMICASFLVKHLLIDWRRGEQWFWDTLVDADYAQNSVNWQWVVGSGVDANMFVRLMAPLGQSEKFDAAAYIREWVPELAHLSAPAIHDPDVFGQRPQSYPAKIIDHRAGRERALAAWAQCKGNVGLVE
ncbi:MAG: deoxyribodipyrimidine photo-lyase [Sphingobium sp.]|nr:deoxyribodipyrimidine photo-lyase [Sphingobium sp.]